MRSLERTLCHAALRPGCRLALHAAPCYTCAHTHTHTHTPREDALHGRLANLGPVRRLVRAALKKVGHEVGGLSAVVRVDMEAWGVGCRGGVLRGR